MGNTDAHGFSGKHWLKIHNNNVIERLNREIQTRDMPEPDASIQPPAIEGQGSMCP